MAADDKSHDAWQKTKKLLKIRKIREDKLEREHNMASDRYAHAQVTLQQMREKVDEYLADRNRQLEAMRRRLYTEAVTGLDYEHMLLYEEQTKSDTNKKLHDIAMAALDLEKMAEEVQRTYYEWQPARTARLKIEHIVELKRKDAAEFAELQEEERNAEVPQRRPDMS
jgi:hypothetical protein